MVVFPVTLDELRLKVVADLGKDVPQVLYSQF